MNRPSLEEQIRSLRPSPLPQDLLARMAQPPPLIQPRQTRKIRHVMLFAVMAAIAAWTVMVYQYSNPITLPPNSAPSLSIRQDRSVLLDSQTLTLLHRDGRTWEVVEQQWRDDKIALCSEIPLQVKSSEIRREIICLPVDFY